VSRLSRERGLAVLAVLHDLNLASAVASRVVVIDKGRIVRDGPPAETLTSELVAAIFGNGFEVVSRNGRPRVFPADHIRS
jgi:iron complex transport system ATP-binding protein